MSRSNGELVPTTGPRHLVRIFSMWVVSAEYLLFLLFYRKSPLRTI